MNEQNARAEGLRFTGSYSHDKEEMKTKAKAIRTQGFNARVVNTPPDKLSRGYHGMGYSVYADAKYFAAEAIVQDKQHLERLPATRAFYKAEFDKMIAVCDKNEIDLNARIAANQAILNA